MLKKIFLILRTLKIYKIEKYFHPKRDKIMMMEESEEKKELAKYHNITVKTFEEELLKQIAIWSSHFEDRRLIRTTNFNHLLV